MLSSTTGVVQPRIKLSDEQQGSYNDALVFAADPPKLTYCVHGYAGCGKSVLLAQLARDLRFSALLAPTGKAASIQRTKTRLPARTIHSWLYHLEEIRKDAKGRRDFRWSPAHQPDSLLNQIVLLDECMMVGMKVAQDILATGAIIIAVGDPGQLWPVGQEPFFTAADGELTEIHRQAAGSMIIQMAHRVRQGLPYEAAGEFRVASRAYDKDYLSADILLCWTNRQRLSLNARSRSLRGIWAANPQPGEPLMCQRNHHRSGVYRGGIYRLLEPFAAGDTAIVVDVDGDARVIEHVKFDGLENKLQDENAATSFEFGYACTVHSAAGSEWDNVLLFDDHRQTDEYNSWIYTGITRAANRITVVR